METLKILIPIILIVLGLMVSLIKKLKVLGKVVICSFLALLFGVWYMIWGIKPSIHNVSNTNETSKTEGSYFTMAGSNTIGDILAAQLVTAYLQKNGATDIKVSNTNTDEKEITAIIDNSKIHINILAHGTSTGFKALTNNSADICMASNPTDDNSLVEHIIGMDGITIVVNSNNSITELSLDDIRKIFTGEISNWNQIGGNNTPINLYRRDDKSGTFKTFVEMALNKQPISTKAKSYEKSEDIVKEVSNDVGAIGFVSYSFVNPSIKVISLKPAPNLPAIRPNSLSIQTEKYPLCRRLYLYTTSSTTNVNVKSFLGFVESQLGQDIVEKSGFVNLTINEDHPIKLPDDPIEYKKLINTCKKQTTELRFKFGSSDLDARAESDLNRLVDLLSKSGNRNKQVVLAGFTDNVGNAETNKNLSLKRANIVAEKLRNLSVTVSNTYGFGDKRPVNRNSTPEEQSFNRRVEVWLK